MAIEKMRIRLQGVRPLLMHSSRLADPLDPAAVELARATGKRAKTRADHEAIAKIEWHGSLWARDGLPCIPGEAIEAALVDAAKSVRKKRQAQIGFFCMESPLLDYPGPRSVEQLWADPAFRLRYPVRVNNARTIRTRPRFAEWSVAFEAEYVPTALAREEIVELFRLAGFRTGIGDWRPRFGRFEAFEA